MAMSTATNSQPVERNPEKTTSSAKPQFPKLDENDLYPLVNDYAASDTLVLLLTIRFLNALFVGTFFQPDEYFQSLEPAWQMAFGAESGAWITWEWQYQLRSSLHPALFAGAYALVGKALPGFFPEFRAMFLSVLPNIVQGLIAAAGDYYTWRLAERIHGKGSDVAWTCLLMSMFSPWQWFCSTRTFSNSLETTLTIVALNFWPWEMAGGDEKHKPANPQSAAEGIFRTSESIARLRVSFLAAALACILRPTNLLLWLAAVPFTLLPSLLGSSLSSRIHTNDYIIIARELFLCGSAIFAISSISDRYYFGEWTFPPYHLLNFNISQDLAVFYGSMPFHYYISQGLPLLLTTYLPFAIYSIIKPQPSDTIKATNIRFILSTTIISTLTVLSLITHKEVRFIYPLLPLLHVLIAPNLHAYFNTTETTTKMVGDFPATPVTTTSPATRRGYIKTALLLLNVGIAYYVTRIHQAGVISVMPYLRSEFERLAFEPQPGLFIDESDPVADALRLQQWKDEGFSTNDTLVGFLMPCHSTPWRSALVYPELKAWALSCEPPLHTQPGSEERKNYVDEADRFYANPSKFLTEEVNTREKPWPRYIAGFEGIEKVLRVWYEGESTSPMPGFVMREKWRGKNSHWHDDKRRAGDVVIWEFVDGSMVT